MAVTVKLAVCVLLLKDVPPPTTVALTLLPAVPLV